MKGDGGGDDGDEDEEIVATHGMGRKWKYEAIKAPHTHTHTQSTVRNQSINAIPSANSKDMWERWARTESKTSKAQKKAMNKWKRAQMNTSKKVETERKMRGKSIWSHSLGIPWWLGLGNEPFGRSFSRSVGRSSFGSYTGIGVHGKSLPFDIKDCGFCKWNRLYLCLCYRCRMVSYIYVYAYPFRDAGAST